MLSQFLIDNVSHMSKKLISNDSTARSNENSAFPSVEINREFRKKFEKEFRTSFTQQLLLVTKSSVN